MAAISLREFQMKLLKMLLDFDTFCQENHLTYYLIGGCVLGAVRHKGFIPWDDDVDVALARPEFERLESIINPKMADHYKYEPVEGHSSPNAPIGYLYDISSGAPLSECPCIDVFALDGVPKSRFGKTVQHIFLQLYHICILQQVSQNRGRAAAAFTKLFLAITPRFIMNFYKKISKKIITGWPTENAREWANLFGQKKYHREIMPREYLGAPIPMEFEGEYFPVPEMTHEYLTHLYGDYHILPPPEKRVPEHKDFLA